MPPWLVVAFGSASLVFLSVGFYLGRKYGPVIGRIFEARPFFQPVHVSPEPGGEDVRFATDDGLNLFGTYYPSEIPRRLGVVAFCHEFLGDRHTVHHYADDLRGLGFDVFTFDFRNHGESDSEPGHEPLQWVSDRDVRDLRAALDYLRSRPDADPAGAGLFGVSRGGGVALAVAGEDPSVWAVVTDGAFPTRGTMLAYILRWAEIYVRRPWVRALIPMTMYRYVGWVARKRSERLLDRRFPDLEQLVRRIGPRPWLAIHGAQDNYIGPEIARGLYDHALEPKRFWLVEGAKHNRCRELAGNRYGRTVADWFLRFAPRSAHAPVPASATEDDGGGPRAGGVGRMEVVGPGSR